MDKKSRLAALKPEVEEEFVEEIKKNCAKRQFKCLELGEQVICHMNYRLIWQMDGPDIVFKYCPDVSENYLFSERWEPTLKQAGGKEVLQWSRRYEDARTTAELAKYMVQSFKSTVDAWQVARAKGFSKKAMTEMLRKLHEEE